MNTSTETEIVLIAPPGPVVVISRARHDERDFLLGESAVITAINDSTTMASATRTLSRLDSMARSVDKTGEDLRRPFTAFAKQIKAVADTFLTDVNKEQQRIGRLIADKANAERRAAAELEAQRQAEAMALRRKADEEAARIEAAQMKAKTDVEYAALEERKRIAALEADREQRRLASVVVEAPATPGVTVRAPVWKFKVVNVAKLPPEYVMQVANEIALQVAINNGVREIDGCEIWSEQPKAFTAGNPRIRTPEVSEP